MPGKPASMSVNETVTRPREHLTEREIDKLMTTARQEGRYGHRDATAILVAFWHGLRASELCALEWDQIDLTRKTIRIHRAKGGDPATHYLSNSELRALRRLQRENPPGPHVFVSERGGPVTTAWFRKMFARLGERASMPFAIHPHQLRHSCGYKFANEGKDTRSATSLSWGTAASIAPCVIPRWHQIGFVGGKKSSVGESTMSFVYWVFEDKDCFVFPHNAGYVGVSEYPKNRWRSGAPSRKHRRQAS